LKQKLSIGFSAGVAMKQQSIARKAVSEITQRFESQSGAHSEFARVNPAPTIRFGPFCVHPRSRKLFADGQPVDLGSRAFDLLIVLLEAQGALVSKDSIMQRLWPTTVVEECNLRQQMAFLRKALGGFRDAIKTIPGRGYIFAAGTERIDARAFMSAVDANPAAASHRCITEDLQTRAQQGSHESEHEALPTVVIVDDDEDVREALSDFLQAAGLRVEVFASIQEFLNRSSEAQMGCLVLDIMLPGRNGLDFQGDLARAGVALPVVFISGHADIPMSVRAMKAGAIEFLTKPVSHQHLLDAIFCALGRLSRVSEC
jgi:DNA-binding response OmpR family regulator